VSAGPKTQVITHASSEGGALKRYKNKMECHTTQSCILLLTFSSSDHLLKVHGCTTTYFPQVVHTMRFCPTGCDQSP
jgi:hypothetical protein